MVWSSEILHQLPPLSPEAVELIQSFGEEVDSHGIVSLIERDPGLSVRVLRIANSAFYGMPGRIGSIRDAVLLLGMSTLRSIALASVMSGVFAHSSAGVLDLRKYWRDSFLVALHAQALERKWGGDGLMAFTAGLLHDIGLVVLELTNPALLRDVFRVVQENSLPLLEVERAIVGAEHYELGAELLAFWHLPAEIVRAVELQGDDDQIRDNRLASAVNLAKTIVSVRAEPVSDERYTRIIVKCRTLGVDPEGVLANQSDWDKFDEMVFY